MVTDIENLLRYGRREPSSTFWCKRCGVPLIQERCEACGKQGSVISRAPLRPVFHEELNIIRKQSGSRSKLLSLPDLAFWSTSRNYFYYNGKKIITILRLSDGKSYEIKFLKGKDINLPKRFLKPETVIARIRKANKTSLNYLEYQAIEFIEKATKSFSERLPIVSFSGGKDSCVISHLARLALGPKTVHLFGDTTIEYPDTYKFIQKFKRDNPIVPFLTAKPSKDFFELVEQIGPPSRILRWCCTTHKTGPMSSLINAVNGNGVLAFVGNRKAESYRRSKYNAIEFKHKIANEILVNPILTWSDSEVWIYILARGIKFSDGYKHGLRRAGCLYCPFNTGWSECVASTIYDKHQTIWKSILREYAKRIKHPNKKDFVNQGWKVRAGGNGIKPLACRKKACDTDDDAFSYTLKRNWDNSFWEYLKPLGQVIKLSDDGIIANYSVVNAETNESMIMLRVSKPRNHIRVNIIQQKEKRLLISRLDRQISRFQVCVFCGQCQVLCKHGALSTQKLSKFEIDEKKCSHCLDCVKEPCTAVKSFHISKEK